MKLITCQTGLYGVNTYLITGDDSDECIIIDLGENFDRIKRTIEQNKLVPKYVLLTHSHFDHISSLNEMRKTYDVKVYAHEFCANAITDPNLNLSIASMFSKKPITCKRAENILNDDDEITLCKIDIKAIHAPGHSEGSMVYVINDCAFTGDVIFKGSIGRTDFFGANYEHMQKSLGKLKKQLSPNMKIYPGHGESSDMQFELENNPFLK